MIPFWHVTALGAKTDSTAPTTPTGIVATVMSQTRIDLTWNAATDAQSGVNHYKVYKDGAFLATSSTTSHSATGLTANTQYTFTVSAVDNAGNEGSQSSGVNARTWDSVLSLVGPFTSTDYFENTTAADANAFDATPFSFGALIHMSGISGVVDGVVCGKVDPTGRGVSLFQDGLSMYVIITNGSNANVNTAAGASKTIIANKTYAVAVIFDGANIKFVEAAGQIGSDVACTGYTLKPVGLVVGNRNGGAKRFLGKVAGKALTNVAVSVAEAQAWCVAAKARNDVLDFSTGTVKHTFSAYQSMQIGNGGAVTNPWVPITGSNNTMEMTGTVGFDHSTSPDYGN